MVTRSATKVVLTRKVTRNARIVLRDKISEFLQREREVVDAVLVDRIVPTKGARVDVILSATAQPFFFREAYFNHLRTFRRPDRGGLNLELNETVSRALAFHLPRCAFSGTK